MDKSFVIGIDIGGTNFRIGAVTHGLEIVAFRKIPVHQVFHSASPLEDLKRFLVEYMKENNLDIIPKSE